MRVTPVAPVVSVQKDKPYKSIEEAIAEVKEVREVKPDVVVDITWVQGFDGFIGELVHGRDYGQVK
jgi:hypothetical protein